MVSRCVCPARGPSCTTCHAESCPTCLMRSAFQLRLLTALVSLLSLICSTMPSQSQINPTAHIAAKVCQVIFLKKKKKEKKVCAQICHVMRNCRKNCPAPGAQHVICSTSWCSCQGILIVPGHSEVPSTPPSALEFLILCFCFHRGSLAPAPTP